MGLPAQSMPQPGAMSGLPAWVTRAPPNSNIPPWLRGLPQQPSGLSKPGPGAGLPMPQPGGTPGGPRPMPPQLPPQAGAPQGQPMPLPMPNNPNRDFGPPSLAPGVMKALLARGLR